MNNYQENPFIKNQGLAKALYGLLSINDYQLELITENKEAQQKALKELQNVYFSTISLLVKSEKKEEATEQVLETLNDYLDYYYESMDYINGLVHTYKDRKDKEQAQLNYEVCSTCYIMLSLVKERIINEEQ